jgi:hypothetical protein
MAAVANKLARRPAEILAILALLCGALVSSFSLAQSDWRFAGVDRVVAVADIHGAYDAFETILKKAALIDDSLSWIGAAAHLVIVGDVLDRGPDSRLALDLIRKLERQAVAAGGRVHFVLGNHEIMNLTGDLRYVSAAEYAAFADQEPAAIRQAEFERYLADPERTRDPREARESFNAAYPLGFFAHRSAFAPDGEYGAWLLGKPFVVAIDDTVFVHGGMIEAMVEHESDLNQRLTAELNGYVAAIDSLVSADLLSRTTEVYDMPARATEILERAETDDSVAAAARQLIDLDTLLLFAPDGPLWYRGNVGCNRLNEQERIAPALQALGAAHLVVGHTPTQGAVVLSRMDELLLRIDTGMLNDYYGGRAAALVIEGDKRSVIYENESDYSAPIEQPRRVGVRPGNLTAEELEAVLTLADVGTSQRFDGTATLVTLVYRNTQLLGLFTRANREDVRAEVAAYRLDRLLGLDLVPVTVAREIEGVEGAVQFWPQSSISETERREAGLGGSAWCPLADQFKDMYLFDALIFNEARTLDRIRYSTDNLQLLLLGHDQAFSTESGRPSYLESLPVELTAGWRNALRALDEATLARSLGDVLDRRRIRALLARRDHLLDIAAQSIIE